MSTEIDEGALKIDPKEKAGKALQPRKSRPRSWLSWLPMAVALALSLTFLYFHDSDSSKTYSPLVGKPVKAFEALALKGDFATGPNFQSGFTQDDFSTGEPKLLNIWASWCVPCRQEHALLIELSLMDGIPIYGLNYKDRPEDASAFLRELGNPYRAVGVDPDGRVSIQFGRTGVPETYLIGSDGIVLYRYIGPLTPSAIEETLRPLIAQARDAGAS